MGIVLQPVLPLFPPLAPSLPDCVCVAPPVTGGLPLQYQVEYVPRLIRRFSPPSPRKVQVTGSCLSVFVLRGEQMLHALDHPFDTACVLFLRLLLAERHLAFMAMHPLLLKA